MQGDMQCNGSRLHINLYSIVYKVVYNYLARQVEGKAPSLITMGRSNVSFAVCGIDRAT